MARAFMYRVDLSENSLICIELFFFFNYGIKHCFVVVKAYTAENIGIFVFCNLYACHDISP